MTEAGMRGRPPEVGSTGKREGVSGCGLCPLGLWLRGLTDEADRDGPDLAGSEIGS